MKLQYLPTQITLNTGVGQFQGDVRAVPAWPPPAAPNPPNPTIPPKPPVS